MKTVKLIWNIGDIRNLCRKPKTKLGRYHVELRKPKGSPEKITLTLVATHQFQDIEKAHSKDQTFCLKWTLYKGGRKVCINFQSDTDRVNIVV